MKHTLFILTILFMGVCTANAATPWWEQATVCRLNPSKCYASMGAGFESEMWDQTSQCWGQKIICAEALISGNENIPMERKTISANKNINHKVFDTDEYSSYNECFGVRITTQNGAFSFDNAGNKVRVWCPGILSAGEIAETQNGEIIISGAQPTCRSLANDGFIATLNSTSGCHGKQMNQNAYYIGCNERDLEPETLVVLNGAYDYSVNGKSITMDQASDIFEKMIRISAQQREKYTEQ